MHRIINKCKNVVVCFILITFMFLRIFSFSSLIEKRKYLITTFIIWNTIWFIIQSIRKKWTEQVVLLWCSDPYFTFHYSETLTSESKSDTRSVIMVTDLSVTNLLTLSGDSLVAQTVGYPSSMQETQVQSLGQEYPLEKGMTTHSSILPWRIPWTEKPDGLQPMGLQRVGHNWTTNTLILSNASIALLDFIMYIRKAALLPVKIIIKYSLVDIFIFLYGKWQNKKKRR